MSEPQYGLAIMPDGKEANVVVIRQDELGHTYAARLETAEWVRVEDDTEPAKACTVHLSEYAVKLSAAGLIECLTHTDLGSGN